MPPRSSGRAEQVGDLVRVFAEGHHAVLQLRELPESRVDVLLRPAGQLRRDDREVDRFCPLGRRQEQAARIFRIPQRLVARRCALHGRRVVDQPVRPQQVADAEAVRAGAVLRRDVLQVRQPVQVGLREQARFRETGRADAGERDDVVGRPLARGLDLRDHPRRAVRAIGDHACAGLLAEAFRDVAQRGRAGIVGPREQAQRLACETARLCLRSTDEWHRKGGCSERRAEGFDHLPSARLEVLHGRLLMNDAGWFDAGRRLRRGVWRNCREVKFPQQTKYPHARHDINAWPGDLSRPAS